MAGYWLNKFDDFVDSKYICNCWIFDSGTGVSGSIYVRFCYHENWIMEKQINYLLQVIQSWHVILSWYIRSIHTGIIDLLPNLARANNVTSYKLY